MDFRADGTNGIIASESYLSGNAYAANFGWIDFGDGTPDNGHSYSNTSATDYGVNLSSTGTLTGYAYSANIGWIQFEQTHGKPVIDFLSGQISGSAYSGNVGWIALDTLDSDLVAVSLSCPDSDHDGIGDAFEMLHFGALHKIDATSDYDHDGHSDLSEYIANTNPDDRSDFLTILGQTYNGTQTEVNILFTSKPNRLYRIEHDTHLGPIWTDSNLGTFSPGPGTNTLSNQVLFTGGPRRFFRVVAQKPLQP